MIEWGQYSSNEPGFLCSTMNKRDALQVARRLRANMTAAERYFWNEVRNRRFYGLKFYRQYIIHHAEIMDQRRYYIVDFYCATDRTIIEIDGSIHELQKDYDDYREEILLQMGYRVIRFTNSVVLKDWPSVERSLLKIFRVNNVKGS